MKPNYRARCARTHKVLADTWGEPKWEGPLDPIDVLVQEVILKKTSSPAFKKGWANFKKTYPEWEKVADARTDALTRSLKGCSVTKTQVKSMIRLAGELRKEYGTASLEFTRNMSVREAMRALESLELVDLKIGATIILQALGREICPVDENMLRVFQRMGIIRASAELAAAFEFLQPLVPKGKAFSFHANVQRLGTEICKPSTPKCRHCPVEIECRFPGKKLPRK